MAKVSIILPSRNEQFLPRTVQDLLDKATGDIEVIPVLDGYDTTRAEIPTFTDRRVKPLRLEPGQGMRGAINEGIAVSTGEFVMKLDGHCMVDKGFDEVLQADMEENWVVIPRRYSLDAINWTFKHTGKSPVDAHFLSYPFELSRAGHGLHGTVWNDRARTRKEILIDDEMSSQGSCWFTTRTHWDRLLNPLDVEKYGNFVQEFQEIGNKVWLSGGRVVINKKTWYAHLHKGKEFGRGYWIDKRHLARGQRFCVWYWMNDRWEERTFDFRWLIEKFWPVPSWPTNPDGSLDWDTVQRMTAEYNATYDEARGTNAIGAETPGREKIGAGKVMGI